MDKKLIFETVFRVFREINMANRKKILFSIDFTMGEIFTLILYNKIC